MAGLSVCSVESLVFGLIFIFFGCLKQETKTEENVTIKVEVVM